MKRNNVGLISFLTTCLLLNLNITTTTTAISYRLRVRRGEWLKEQEQDGSDGFESPRRVADACEGWMCGEGRECRRGEDSLPDCICREQCPDPDPKGQKEEPNKPQTDSLETFDFFQWDSFYSSDENSVGPVCGSDGIIYPSECELHRTACLTSQPFLVVDNSPTSNRCQHPVQKPTKDSPPIGRPPDTQRPPLPSQPPDDETKDSDEDYSSEEDDEDDSSLEDYSSSFKFQKFLPNSKSLVGKGHASSFTTPSPIVSRTSIITTPSTVTASSSNISSKSSSSSSTRKSRVVGDSKILKRGSSLCSHEEYEILKHALLVYSHQHLVTKGVPSADELQLNGLNGAKRDKAYLLSLMFAHFDHDHNGGLDYAELQKIGFEEKIGRAALLCHPVDLLRFDDTNHDRRITPQEFYISFNRVHSMRVARVEKTRQVIHLTAKVGQSVEMRCNVEGELSPSAEVIWSRYGIMLSRKGKGDKVSIFPHGMLRIRRVDLLHAGNYTCHPRGKPHIIQPYHLSVQTEPEVKVHPHMVVWEKPGGAVELECRVRGEPQPKVIWLKNEVPLATEDMRDKYTVQGDGITLTVQEINVSDTGAYMCEGQNEAGTQIDIASLVVMDEQSLPPLEWNATQFLLFHQRGISAYDPTNCRLQHQILATDIIPGTQDKICGGSSSCEWGRATKVSSSYVYVSQPLLHRLLVISISQMLVVDVIETNSYPVQLHYVPHVDQIWVECWRGGEDYSGKYLQVIRNAKEKRKHRAVHPKLLHSDGAIQNVFLPPDLPTSSQFYYAYIAHQETRGLYKVDLRTLRYVKSIDLSAYNCLPEQLHFSTYYGFIILECREPVFGTPTGQLVLDALTDALVAYKKEHQGSSWLSPDSRKLVTLVHHAHGTTIILQLVKENGLEFSFDVNTSLNLSDVAFFPSQSFHSYDLYASAIDKEDVLFLDLHSGRVELVPGVGRPRPPDIPEYRSWKRPLRSIQSEDVFGKYLASPSEEAVFVLNGQTHTINCEVGGMPKPSLIVWL